MTGRCSLRLALVLALLARQAAAESIAGKVVAVADGDTLTVRSGQSALKVRLHGVDAPEKDQASGEAARRFTAALVLDKEVRVEVVTRDKYGRSVGTVHLGTRCLNDELVKAGLAWWYRQYAPRDRKLAVLEEEARRARRGLWADASPTPPWDFRHADLLCSTDADCVFLPPVCPRCPPCQPTSRRVGNRTALRRIEEKQARVRCAVPRCPACANARHWLAGTPSCVRGRCALASAAPSAPPATTGERYRGNVRSRVFHAPGCKDQGCRRCTALFARAEDARRAGYRPHACVAGHEACVALCLERSRARATSADAITASCRRSCTSSARP